MALTTSTRIDGGARTGGGTRTDSAATDARGTGVDPRIAGLAPLALDVALPLAVYFTAHSLLGLSLVTALGLGSAVPAVRTVASLVRRRPVNALALLMLTVNVAGIALSAVAGDARLMIAKDGAVSSVIGGAIMISALLGRPAMSAGLRPFLVKNRADREAAWLRLSAGDDVFRRNERNFSLAWGTVLLIECAAKIVGAYVFPVETMVWLGPVMLSAAITVGIAVGNVFAGRMAERLGAETL
ncbi:MULTISPECIES: VC0807 family protein [unclassified Kitasatospora]|uniref:VC0807 family protein n=1 Tax=unclassified Kitasatospora TaxID=2633591 RepID=UPI000A80ABAF|nr:MULTISPECIES: VC0807 family protein [unclassified Kitasatospora]